jgi:intein/homing endonuclease
MPRSTLGKGAARLIERAVDSLYDRVKAKYLGPDLSRVGDKRIMIGYKPELTLPALYQAAAAEEYTKPDKGMVQSLVRIADGYLEANRAKTKAKVIASVEQFLRDAESKGVKTDVATVLGGQLADVWGQATTEVNCILDTEATHARNLGTLDGISKVNAARGIEDPVVYFIVVRDKDLCAECKGLHLMPDGVTPRLWRLSEVSHGYHNRGDETPSIGGLHPHCFVGDTKLHTAQGLRTLEALFKENKPVDVVVDQRVVNRRVGNNQFGSEIAGDVWFHRHRSGTSIKPASAVYDTGSQECYEIELDSGQILRVSAGHDMWVDDGNKGSRVRADSVRVGDKIPLVSGEGGWGSDSFEDLAELMGNLIGDGCITSKTAQWNFFGDDLRYGLELKRKARKYAGHMSDTMKIIPPDWKYNVPRATFNSPVLRNIFVNEFGLSKKPRRVPARIWTSTKETAAAFLRGLYSADGHADKPPSIVLAQNDLDFLREVQLLLSNFGIVARIFEQKSPDGQEVEYADGSRHAVERKPCWRLCIGGVEQVGVFLREIGFGVLKKQKNAERWVSAFSGKSHGAWRTSRVIRVTPLGPLQTYCLTEPMTNTVTANGIVTGNCRCTLATLLLGYGFDKAGQLRYIGEGHDEYAKQRGEEE